MGGGGGGGEVTENARGVNAEPVNTKRIVRFVRLWIKGIIQRPSMQKLCMHIRQPIFHDTVLPMILAVLVIANTHARVHHGKAVACDGTFAARLDRAEHGYAKCVKKHQCSA